MVEKSALQPPIAVVGLGALFPGATANDGFWKNIIDGKDLIEEVPPSHWLIEDYFDPDPSKSGKSYGKRGAFLQGVSFDPLDHVIPPNNLSATDTAQLLALVVAKRVLYDACRLDFNHIDPARTSVILGVASATELAGTMSGSLQYPVWKQAMREAGVNDVDVDRVAEAAKSLYADWNENTFPGLLGNVVAGRIASRFGLGGTNCVIDAACASSLAAVHMAVQELWLGQSDLVITGGVDALNDVFMFICFSRTPALSPSGDCRPFADNADGTVLGEGVGMLALRRLEDAERDGDQIYAVLRGLGSSSDGRAKSIYAPRPEGQALALERAYAAAGYDPDTVELVEAHGTGTVAGDLAELEALSNVFGRGGRSDAPWCAIGSVKSQIGHTKGAAGSAALIKAVLALHHKALPPTIKVSAPHRRLKEAGVPFYVNSELRPWIRGDRHPRRASVSSFGFGGSNFHVAVEEYRGSAPRPGRIRHLSSELFLFSAPDAEGLSAALRAAQEEAAAPGAFASAAKSSQTRFDRNAPHRLAIVARQSSELDSAFDRVDASVAAGTRLSQPGLHYAAVAAVAGPIAFLFPGQGSQYVGMGAELALAFEAARVPWDCLADSSEPSLCSLPRIVFPPPAFGDDERRGQQTELTATARAQPAIAVSSLCYLDLILAASVRADMLGGHSFGELTALYAAGAMSRTRFLELARCRGEILQDASSGAMLAVFAPREAVEKAVGVKTGSATIANHNAPDQVVVAGSLDAIEAIARELSAQGVNAQRIPVSAAFHSPLVAAAREPFRIALAEQAFSQLSTPVYANATARPYPSHEGIAKLLSDQIVQEVRFCDQIEAMHADGARIFVEVGPGHTLTELVKRCLGDRPHLAVALDGKAKDGVWRFWNALGQLAINGVAIDFAPFWDGYELETPNLEAGSPISVEINGSNYGKRYPAPSSSPPRAARTPRPSPEPSPSSPASPPSFDAVSMSKPLAPPPPSLPFVQTGEPQMDAPRPPASPSAASLASSANGADGRLQGLVEIIRSSSQAHQVAQKALADTHLAYLKATEAALRLLAGAGAEQGALAAIAPPAPAPTANAAPVVFAEHPAPETFVEPFVMPSPASFVIAEPTPTAVAAPPPPGPSRDTVALILDIVAAKTGYPASMLTPDMELERDLGIDSIKRVEILAAVRQALPDLPAIDPNELASLTTLRAIGERFAAAPGQTPPAAAAASDASPKTADAQSDIAALLLDIIAEKTGYPVSMLKPEMELERDLGVDSIKRVEILAAVRKAAPDLPQVDMSELAALTTLAAIGEKLRGALSPASIPLPNPADEPRQPGAIRRVVLEARETARPVASLRPLRVAIQDSPIAAALVAALDRRGVRAEQFAKVPGAGADALVLFSLDDEDPAALCERAVEAARTFASQAGPDGGLMVTVQDTGGDFGLSAKCGARAWTAGLSGLAKTAAREWPRARVKAIDLECRGVAQEKLAETLADELLCGGEEVEIGLPADGRRITLHETERSLPVSAAVPSRLSEGSVIVVTGARGVTAACVRALSERLPIRLAFLGRSKLLDIPAEFVGLGELALRRALATRDVGIAPDLRRIAADAQSIHASGEVQRTLGDLAASGVEVFYQSVDVADAAAVREAIGAVRRRWGRIDGIVHGAGQLADKLIEASGAEQVRKVFAPKVAGLKALLDATADDELSLIALFSSIAGRYGNPGQSGYAMANEILNKVARAEAARRGPACLVRALNWGPWSGGMVTAELQRHFAERGVATIDLEAGAKAFAAEIMHGSPDPSEVEVVLFGAPPAAAASLSGAA
jgi:acyl transferase domain-containing protein/NADP-dependent 3-hydroxy acid dehydrogenase YdfG/acyl carrier protein